MKSIIVVMDRLDKWSVLGRLTVAEGRDGTSVFLIFLNVTEQE